MMKLSGLDHTHKSAQYIVKAPKYLTPKAISYEPGSMNLPALPPMSAKLQKAILFIQNMVSSVIH